MSTSKCLRFVKTPGSMPLPAGFKRQYRVLPDAAEDGPSLATFNLDQPQLFGRTECSEIASGDLSLLWEKAVGSVSWKLVRDGAETLAEISARGVLSQGWIMTFRGGPEEFELVNPQGLAKQIVTTMLDGETEGLILMQAGAPIGSLSKQHRSKGGGVFSGLKRFVVGRDWVLSFDRELSDPDLQNACLAFALVAIVSLEHSSPD